jgi:osmoprotectant transport system ATP-binding protein
VARALAAEPPLLLMDEPFGAVDPIVRQHLQDELLRLHRQLGTTILLVTHDLDEAIKLGDRVAVMQQGRLVQYARPAELLSRPANEFVARFLGADRELKLLGLLTVADVPLEAAEALHAGAPRVGLGATLREALPALLAAPLGAGVVVDANGYEVGAISVEAVGRVLRALVAGDGTGGRMPAGLSVGDLARRGSG